MDDFSAAGTRIARLRLAAGLSQVDLAAALGLKSNGLISKIENGRVVADSEVVATLAHHLGCTPEFLARPDKDVLSTKPWLRAYADASSKVVDRVVADNHIAHEVAVRAKLTWVPDTAPVFDGDLNDEHEIELFAQEVRAGAEIPEDGAVRNAMRAAERLGCVVLPLSAELGRHMGMSQRINGRPFIRVARSGATPGDRQRFTVAHELGHVCLHATVAPPDTAEDARRIETQAHRFAAAFLAPAEPLLEDWSSLGARVTLSTLQELKKHWGVSIKALVVRFRHLGIVDDDQARSLYRQISARGWNMIEPMPVSTEEPIWLKRALARRYGTKEAAVLAATVGTEQGLNDHYIEDWLDWAPNPTANEKVVELDLPRGGTRKQATDSGGGSSGEVVSLSHRRWARR